MQYRFDRRISVAAFLMSVFLFSSLASASVPLPDPVKLAAIPATQRALVEQLLSDIKPLPAGVFQIGNDEAENDDEQPAVKVTLKSFGLTAKEITFAQYDVFAKATGRALPDDQNWGRGDRPVMNVSWEDARDFAKWLAEKSGLKWRLPSEAEWEYAALAGSNHSYSFGDDLAVFCTYGNVADASTKSGWRNKKCGDNFSQTSPVGHFKANAWGLHDMHGNVWEWVQDCWQTSYRNMSETGAPNESGSCRERVQRGGSWFYGPEDARAGYRSSAPFADKGVQVGFRLALDLAP
jgi:formylglycine-generating enzyme required for sulfatase activity